jgi:UDP-glucose 4-epimerase
VPRHERVAFHHERVSEAVRGVLAGARFDEIYHLAASVGVKLVVEDPAGCIENNVHETSALLRFAREAGASGAGCPTLLASTSEVYGKADKSPFREDDDVVYGPTTVFRWAYAQSKAIDEYLGLAMHRAHGFPVVIARFFNTVGPRQVGDYGMVLPRFVQAALRGETLRVFGDGMQTRCFCDVRDVVGVLPRMLASPQCTGRVFNVGSDRVISMLDLAKLVIRTLHSGSTIDMVPYDRAFVAGFEDLRQRRPDVSRLREAVGFEATIGLERTIEDVAASLRSAGGAV